MASSTKTQRAFSLIELLAVMAIIASLAALLFPAFQAAKETAKKVTCISNLSSVGKAEFMYRADYDDRYPYAITDPDRIGAPYTIPGGADLTPSQIAQIPNIVDVITPYLGDKRNLKCDMDMGLKDVSGKQVVASAFQAYGTSYEFLPILSYPVLDPKTGEDVSDSARLVLAEDFSLAWHSGGETDFLLARHDIILADGHARASLFSQEQNVYP